MNIKDLRALVALADAGSVSRAASTLRITQPALTRRIQNLETHLQVSLVDRATKPPTLTATGRRVLDRGRSVLRSLSELEASCREDAETIGPLRLGVAHGLAEDVLTDPLTELTRTFPQLELIVKTGWTMPLTEEIDHAALDAVIGFVPTERSDSSLRAMTLGQEDIAVIAPRRSTLDAKLGLSNLDDVSWVLNPSGCSYRTSLEAILNRQSIPLRVAMEVVGRELQLSLVARGAGLGLCPLRSLRASPHAHHIKVFRLQDVNIRTDIAMICGHGTSDLSDVFETLSDAVERALAVKANSEPGLETA